MNPRDRLPVAIAAALLVAWLGGFQAVVQASVDRGASRRAAVARAAEQTWRCNSLRAGAARTECLLARDPVLPGGG